MGQPRLATHELCLQWPAISYNASGVVEPPRPPPLVPSPPGFMHVNFAIDLKASATADCMCRQGGRRAI